MTMGLRISLGALLLTAPFFVACGDSTPANQPPTVDLGTSIELLPGDSLSLAARIGDADGDPLTCTWSGTPAQVSVTGGCLDAVLAVDRARYEGGPGAASFSLSVEVSDGVNPAVTDSVEVIVGDERGPYVSNLSSFEGTGYGELGARHGYCGAQTHPCANPHDAIVNLRAAITDGLNSPPKVLLATTGTDYALEREILLDDGGTGLALTLECGYDPLSWDKVEGEWIPTPLRFSGEVGVRITAEGTRLMGCDVQGADSTGSLLQRVAVQVEDCAASILDNILVGSRDDVSDPPTGAIGLLLEATAPDAAFRNVVQDNSIRGGLAVEAAVGLIAEGLPLITGNRIEGGRAQGVEGVLLRAAVGGSGQRAEVADNPLIAGGIAAGGTEPTAVGLNIVAGDPLVTDNALIAGCASGCSAEANHYGLMAISQALEDSVTLERNTIRGSPEDEDVYVALGAVLGPRSVLSGNSIAGGRAAAVIGLMAGGPLQLEGDSLTGGAALGADPPLDDLDGDAVGFMMTNGAVVAGQGVAITGQLEAAGPAAHSGIGVLVNDGELTLSGGQIDGGPGAQLSRGIEAAVDTVALSLTDVLVLAGDVTVENQNSSIGILRQGGTLDLAGGSVISGTGATSVAVLDLYDQVDQVGTGATSLQGATLRSGTAARSVAVWHLCGLLTVQECLIESGTGLLGAAGLWLDCQDQASQPGPHLVSGGQVTAGTAPDARAGIVRGCSGVVLGGGTEWIAPAAETTSIGLDLEDTSATAEDITAQGGVSLSSAGLRSRGNSTLRLTDAVLTAQGAPADAGDVAALWLVDSAMLSLESSALACGPGGLRTAALRADAALYGARIAGCEIGGGTAAALSAGVDLDGGCRACRLERNFILGSNTTGAPAADVRSVGLRIRLDDWTGDPTLATVVFNNRIVGGMSERSYGLEVAGAAGDDLRVLHNSIDGGGAEFEAGSQSYGVVLNGEAAHNSSAAGVFIGNRIDAGVGDTAIGFLELCFMDGNGTHKGQPLAAGANAFWPAVGGGSGATAYVRRASAANCTATSLTVIGLVSADAVYGVVPGDSLDVDPLLESDRVHLQAGSPLRNASPASLDALAGWPFPGEVMPDIDGQDRPEGIACDIGPDEVWQ